MLPGVRLPAGRQKRQNSSLWRMRHRSCAQQRSLRRAAPRRGSVGVPPSAGPAHPRSTRKRAPARWRRGRRSQAGGKRSSARQQSRSSFTPTRRFDNLVIPVTSLGARTRRAPCESCPGGSHEHHHHKAADEPKGGEILRQADAGEAVSGIGNLAAAAKRRHP
jgi:hypothetical protein